MPWVDQYAEKWQVSNVIGETVTMKITSKTVNPGWYPWDTTAVGVYYKYFIFSGDSVWIDTQELNPVAIFSVQVGDSLFTPYYTQDNLDFWEDCDSAISFLNQKGWIVQAGTEAADGISSRYYDLAFMNEYDVMDTLRFSERSIITDLYWNQILFSFNGCALIIDGAQGALVCYYDNAFIGSPCPEIDWFENLKAEEVSNTWEGRVYPNPTSSVLHIFNPKPETLKANLTDIQGRKVKDNIQLSGSATTILEVHDIKPGIYFLNMVMSDGHRVLEKFIKVE